MSSHNIIEPTLRGACYCCMCTKRAVCNKSLIICLAEKPLQVHQLQSGSWFIQFVTLKNVSSFWSCCTPTTSAWRSGRCAPARTCSTSGRGRRSPSGDSSTTRTSTGGTLTRRRRCRFTDTAAARCDSR